MWKEGESHVTGVCTLSTNCSSISTISWFSQRVSRNFYVTWMTVVGHLTLLWGIRTFAKTKGKLWKWNRFWQMMKKCGIWVEYRWVKLKGANGKCNVIFLKLITDLCKIWIANTSGIVLSILYHILLFAKVMTNLSMTALAGC